MIGMNRDRVRNPIQVIIMDSEFKSLGISDKVLKAIEEMGWKDPTPIQVESIPYGLEGRDLLAQAQTGTGKTGAFGSIILEKTRPRQKRASALILTPTRELAIQVADEISALAKYSGHVCVPIYGGQDIDKQFKSLEKGIDIVVGTPGRVKDHLQRGTLDLKGVKVVVLDEADRMLDMGFIEDIESILQKTPEDRQTMLYSATLPEGVKKLAYDYMRNPKEIIVSRDELVLDLTKQYYISVGRKNKLWALCRVIDAERPKAIIFCHTKRMVDILVERLQKLGYRAEAIHGDMTQSKREKVLQQFKNGQVDLLVATDVAARGLDIDNVNYVINYDIPEHPDIYVHRIGRTGRAGKVGVAITFVTNEEDYFLRSIMAYTGMEIEEMKPPAVKGRETVRKVLDYDQLSDIFGMVKFELNIGEKDGVRRNEIVNMLIRDLHMRDIAIGTVEVGGESTVIEVHKDFANRMVKDLPRMKYKGKALKVQPVQR